MNSQIDMMVFAVEGCRGPPEGKREKFVLQGIIKIINSNNNFGGKNENGKQIKVPEDIFRAADLQ